MIVSFLLAGVSHSFAQEEPAITITADKGSYLPGETVQLSGIVTGQEYPFVAIQVKDSDNNLILIRTIQGDQNGNFAIQFKIPPTATSGKFTISASSRVNGFVVTQNQVITAKVPEFPFSGVVLAIAVVIPIIFYRVRT
ncbi:MAG: hypothetical protein AUI60_04835 [Thaumarchaeota archaeon 13_1_40CM_2_39_4]|nr:MAG: hypothetical protein AUI60_04835 [Thaumarchaeota archaeon 13_1_40CM_2_39_4]